MSSSMALWDYVPSYSPADYLRPIGTPYVAWLMVRMDFLLWVTRELKKGGAS